MNKSTPETKHCEVVTSSHLAGCSSEDGQGPESFAPSFGKTCLEEPQLPKTALPPELAVLLHGDSLLGRLARAEQWRRQCRWEDMALEFVLSIREASGQVVEERVAVPREVVERELDAITEYLALLIHMRGNINGSTEVGFEVKPNQEVISTPSLIAQVEHKLKTLFGPTYYLASLNPIGVGGIKLTSGQPAYASEKHGLRASTTSNIIFSFLGTGHGLQILKSGKFSIGPQEPHLRARFDPQGREDYFFQGMPGDTSAYVSAEFEVARARELLKEYGLPDWKEALSPLVIGGWIEDSGAGVYHRIGLDVMREQGWYLGLVYAMIAKIERVHDWSVVIAGGRARPRAMDSLWAGIGEVQELVKVHQGDADVRLKRIDAGFELYAGAIGAAYMSLRDQCESAGRPIEYQKGQALGIDWGGTNIKIVGFKDGELRYSGLRPCAGVSAATEVIERIEEAAESISLNVGQGITIYIGVAGCVTHEGRILATASAPNLIDILTNRIFPAYPGVTWKVRHDAAVGAWYYAEKLGLIGQS